MKVTQEKLPSSQIGLDIEIPAEMSKQTYEKVIQELTRSANIPGFRKGKVPRPILLQRLGQTRIKGTALEELIQKCLDQAIKQEDIKALGNFQLRSSFEELLSQFQPGEPLTFRAAVDVSPEVQLDTYTGLTVKAEEIPYDASQVDKFLEERRTEKATLIPVEGRAAQAGDVAVVDYKGQFALAEGETEAADIPGAQGTDFQVDLSEGRFLEDFINGIIGMTPGETKEIPVQFPDDYGRDDLAGEAANFTITLKELKEKELPALDDDFAQEVSEFQTLAELRESLEKRFKDKADQETASNKEKAIVAELVKLVEVDLPETMVNREVETMLTQTAMQMQQMGMDVQRLFSQDMVRELQLRSRPEAVQRLKQSLALQEVVKRESLQVEPDALEAKLKEVQEQLAGRDIDQERLKEVVESDLLKEKAIKWLEEHGTVELVPQGTLAQDEEETEEGASETETQASETEAEPTSEQ